MKKTNASSLLELSIVLVIFGLIAGGIAAGSFTGVAGTEGAFDATIGINTPISKLSGAGFSVDNIANQSTTSGGVFSGKYGNLFILEGETTTSKNVSAILNPNCSHSDVA